jgi:antitoxin PrlF
MTTATLTSKGQLTMPKAIRDLLGVGPGDRVVFWADADGRVVVEPQAVEVRSLRGSLRPKRQGVTLDDMDRAIRHAGSRS